MQRSHTGGSSCDMALVQMFFWLQCFLKLPCHCDYHSLSKVIRHWSIDLCAQEPRLFDLGDQKILERVVAHSPINTFKMFLYPHDSSCSFFLKSVPCSLLLRIVCSVNLQQDLFHGLMYSYLPQQYWAKGNVLQSINTLILAWGKIKWHSTSFSSRGG